MASTAAHPQIDPDTLDPSELSSVTRTFLDLVAIPSEARDESRVAAWCAGYLEALGVEVHEDDAATTIPGGAGSGNLLVRIPGTVPGTPIFLCAHIDTVALDDDIVPVIEERDGVRVITNGRAAILGGDNKAAVAVMVDLVRELLAGELEHAGVEVLLTPCEEIGLLGAKAFDVSQLTAAHGYVFDHANDIGKVVQRAPTQVSFTARFTGAASHSGIAPEAGRSAIRAAADAVSAMPHGRIDEATTANVGIIRGGTGVNIVPEQCVLHGEVRSLDDAQAAATMAQVTAACSEAGTRHGVDVVVEERVEYRSYAHREQAPVMRHALAALSACGYEPMLVPCGGGSDANVFNEAGVPCVNLPNGMRKIHTADEYIAIDDLDAMLEVARALVRAAAQ
jgi:tripeptide aminopeptidase